MIQVDIATAIVLYLFFSMVLVLGAWVFYGVRHRQKPLEIVRKTALTCNICLHTFIAPTEKGPQRCTRCNSWVCVDKHLASTRN